MTVREFLDSIKKGKNYDKGVKLFTPFFYYLYFRDRSIFRLIISKYRLFYF